MLNLLFCVLLLSNQNDSIINEAIKLFETRHLNPNNLATSADILKDLIKSDSNNVRLNYTLAQVYYTLGDLAKQKQEKSANYYKGLNHSKKAISLDSACAWAHFWYMACLGQISQIKGIFNSLASISEIKREIDIVLRLDPNNVMAYNAKAMIYYELPGILGGDVNKSISLTKKALEINPNYSMAYVTLAKSYIRKKDYRTARAYLSQVLNLQNGWPTADFILDDKPEAIKLLKKIEDE